MINRWIEAMFRLRDKILEGKFLGQLRSKYPAAERWLENRFSILQFNGLPLTALLIALLLNVLLFFHFTEKVMNSKTIVEIDTHTAFYFHSIRTERTAGFFYTLTQLGNVITIVGMSSLVILYLISKRLKSYVISVLLVVAGSGVSISSGKNIYKVNRPSQYSYYPEDSYSFPSGHATIAVAFYGLLAYLLIRHNPGNKFRTIIFFSGLMMILSVGFSRTYLCEHYLSDVLGGYLLGLSWLILAVTFVEWSSRKQKPE